MRIPHALKGNENAFPKLGGRLMARDCSHGFATAGISWLGPVCQPHGSGPNREILSRIDRLLRGLDRGVPLPSQDFPETHLQPTRGLSLHPANGCYSFGLVVRKLPVRLATWPSGKAGACKALIPGSNPGVASILKPLKDIGLQLLLVQPVLLLFSRTCIFPAS